jgi:predicted nucleotidyltransferase
VNSPHAFGLSSQHTDSICSVFRRHPSVDRVIIYGSRAKGNYKPSSDIDLTIIGTGVDTTELLKIENELDELLLIYKIDLSLLHQIANLDLVDHIQRVGQIFYERDALPYSQ